MVARPFKAGKEAMKQYCCRVATTDGRQYVRRARSVVATRQQIVFRLVYRGLKPTATIGSRYATKTNSLKSMLKGLVARLQAELRASSARTLASPATMRITLDWR